MEATATDADIDQQSHPTVAESAASCLHSFQQCVQRAASIHPRELSLVEDQLARFSVWTTNIRVFAPGRAALDHRLREAPDVQDAVIGLLDALAFRVQSCWNSLEPLSSKVAQESSQLLVEVDPKFRQSIQGIANEISLLHRFSNTIRRASKEAQNLKAADSFRIRDDEGNDAEVFITKLFANHVRDKFPGVSDSICQRLAETMVLRRKRILYRRSRYGNAPIRPQETPSQPRVTVPKVQLKIRAAEHPQVSEGPQAAGDASKSAIQSVAQSATTLAPSNFQKASAPSVVSVSKTVALSNHEELPFPPAPLGSLKRKYNEIRRQREEIDKHNLDSPNSGDKLKSLNSVWKEKAKEIEEIIKAVGEVTCPFCFYALPAEDVMDDNKWRLHVKNDLDAYVCLFEDCSLPHELYVHSSAWLNHMREHAMRWRCTSKSHGQFVCDSRDDYLIHMKTAHKGKFSDAQLQALADRNGRVIGPLFRSCPLCGKEEVDSTMDNHIVGHLRFLALKSLPTYEEEGLEGEESQKGCSSASRAQTRSTVENELRGHKLEMLGGGSEASDEHLDTISDGRPEWQSEDISYLDDLDDTPNNPLTKKDSELLELQWGFVLNQHEVFRSLEDDPILQKFLVKHDHETIGKSSLILPIIPSYAPNKTKGLPTSTFNGFTFPPTYTRPPQPRRSSNSPSYSLPRGEDFLAVPESFVGNDDDPWFPSPSSSTELDFLSSPNFVSNDDDPWFPLFPQDDTVTHQGNATNRDHGNPRNVNYAKSFNPEDIIFKDNVTERERLVSYPESDTVIRQDNITPKLAVRDILTADDDPGGLDQWPLPPLPSPPSNFSQVSYAARAPLELIDGDPENDIIKKKLAEMSAERKNTEASDKHEEFEARIEDQSLNAILDKAMQDINDVKRKRETRDIPTTQPQTMEQLLSPIPMTNAQDEGAKIREMPLETEDPSRDPVRQSQPISERPKDCLEVRQQTPKTQDILPSSHSSYYDNTQPGSSKSVSNSDHTAQSKNRPQTTSNENESDTINNEIIQISNRLSNVTWDMIDMENLRLDVTISRSLRVDDQYIPMQVTIHIPRGYPKTGSPQFKIKNTPGVDDSLCEVVSAGIHDRDNSLDAVLTYLSGGIELMTHMRDNNRITIAKPIGGGRYTVTTNMRGNSNEDQQEEALGSFYDKSGNTGGTYTQQHKPRKSFIRLDPDCAICHAPANLRCDCEAKAFEIAVKQAESKIVSPIYRDARVWVRSHAQDFVRERFSRDMQEHQETAAKDSSEQGNRREVIEGHTPPIKEQVNASWRSAVQSFPETLEYFYSLVEVTLPSDDDPAVKDPPLSTLSGSKKHSRQNHLQSPFEPTKAETSKQGEAAGSEG
ncbi:hypothetical protein F5Y00DRAFT_232018 [Daldinia vernicosa]|uniref:uncharacterized protein n=1 Tax=Daldinia vernicosa TaxID=114800 RepID=UPI0020075839|nr:uncharacterized protein F5Y00DRAFT_232018 [Daldinia vernicosa]KAI0850769.1 hypothetical protein F5Y00DRAFT_232018 [Daldinia vernicosa]